MEDIRAQRQFELTNSRLRCTLSARRSQWVTDMSVWRAFKWLAYILVSGFIGASLYILKDQVFENPSPKVASLVATMRIHAVLSLTAVFSFFVLCVGLWLLADRNERLEQLAGSVDLFVPSKRLRPDHLGIVSFNPHY